MPRIIIVIILSLPRLSIAAIVFRLLLWIRLLPLVPPCVIKALLPHRYRRLTFLPRFRRIIVIIIPPLLSLRTTLVPLPIFLFWTLLHLLLLLVLPYVIKALLPHRCRRLTFLFHFRRIIIIIPPLLSLRTTLVPLPRFLFWTLLHHHLLLVLPCVIKALLPHRCRRLTFLLRFRRIIIIIPPLLSLRTTLVPLPRFLFWTLLLLLLLVLPCVIKALLSHHCRRLTSLFHFRRIIVMSPFLSLRTLVPLPLLPSNLLLLLPAGTWPISIS